MVTRVTSTGQVTIPKAFRDLLGVVAGDGVAFDLIKDGRVVLSKIDPARPVSRFEALIGCADAGLSADEVMKLTRGEC